MHIRSLKYGRFEKNSGFLSNQEVFFDTNFLNRVEKKVCLEKKLLKK
jgi:hypothetical protein